MNEIHESVFELLRIQVITIGSGVEVKPVYPKTNEIYKDRALWVFMLSNIL